MQEIIGTAKSVEQLLQDVKYSIDYYQREYRWDTKHVQELLEDLTSRFLQDYEAGHARDEVENYGRYFLGSIIISRKNNRSFIVDGQQRLTTLTLLLIHLHHLRSQYPDPSKIKVLEPLICSFKYGAKTFNIDVDERTACMEALFDNRRFETIDKSESVQNICVRYEEIEEKFPTELQDKALPYFVDWLVNNVHLVEITAFSDEDAYTIFETMNDRGLSLTPTEMLKGYILSNISKDEHKTRANKLWRERILELNELDKDMDADFFKAWMRSQYAESIRERKRGAQPEEFDRIGTEFHRFVRDFHERIGLNGSESYLQFIERDFDFYSRLYLRLMRASKKLTSGLEHVYYNAQHGFTLQYMVLLAPITREDSHQEIDLKLRLTAIYIDIMLNRRLWNFRSIAYSTMQYAMFLLMRDIRRKEPPALMAILRERLDEEKETFSTNDRLYMHQQNRRFLQRMLARMIAYIEKQSGMPSRYVEYTTGKGNKRYEIEHIWAEKPERHVDEFPHPTDFLEYRDRIGGLILLPKSFNASYGDLPYDEKLPHYNTHNILARSLHPQCYAHNPGFVRFVKESGLPFRPHETFKKADLDERQKLYRDIAQQVWDPELLTQELESTAK